MNVKNLILVIALLIAAVVASAIKVTPDNCLTKIFLVMMGIIILLDWISSYVKFCSQKEEQKEIERKNNDHNSKIIENNLKIAINKSTNEKKELEEEIERLKKEKENLEKKLNDLKSELYNEGFFEWYKLKVLADKDYLKKPFDEAIKEYEEFKKSVK